VRAHVAHPIDPDEPARVVAGPAADAGDEPVASDESPELTLGLLGDARLLGPADDRSERPVDIEDDRSSIGRFGEGVES
jgi:hypothetical protein